MIEVPSAILKSMMRNRQRLFIRMTSTFLLGACLAMPTLAQSQNGSNPESHPGAKGLTTATQARQKVPVRLGNGQVVYVPVPAARNLEASGLGVILSNSHSDTSRSLPRLGPRSTPDTEYEPYEQEYELEESEGTGPPWARGRDFPPMGPPAGVGPPERVGPPVGVGPRSR